MATPLFSKTQSKYKLVLKGKIIDSLLFRKNTKSLQIMVSSSTFPSADSFIDKENFNLEKGYNEPFELTFISEEKFIYLTFGVPGIMGSYPYIFELKGDSVVNFNITKSGLRFIGDHVSRLQCQSDIFRIDPMKDYLESFRKLSLNGQYSKIFNLLDAKQDSVFSLRMKIVEKYRPIIGDHFADVMIANCYGMRYYFDFRRVRLVGGTEEIAAFLNSTIYTKSPLRIPNISTIALISSPIFTDYLLQKLTFIGVLENRINKMSEDERMFQMLKSIETGASGLLKEKLITLFLITTKMKVGNDSVLTNMLPHISNHFYRKSLIKSIDLTKNGKPFFEFSLPDSSGKIHNLKDFHNKVLIIDFWYTGCINCIILNKRLEPLHNKYKDNPKITFINVSIDRDSLLWKKSLREGKYTSVGSISLLASQHDPLIKAYNINAYPTVFVIKNGIMYNSQIQSISMEIEKIFTVLDKALTELQ
jgi:thiol-disulfide isomerase/thioredoxin